MGADVIPVDYSETTVLVASESRKPNSQMNIARVALIRSHGRRRRASFSHDNLPP